MRTKNVPSLLVSLVLGTLCLLGAAASVTGCKSLFLAKGYPDYQGDIVGLPLHGSVRVLRDANGIPHIYASDRHDLDGMQILATIGQSGQPGHRHYDDMVRPWLQGELFHLPYRDATVAGTVDSELKLSP
jgi:acyl-homoserine lactone acylase PvdQ